MHTPYFPVIDLAATGSNIRRLRVERGLTVRDLQTYFGFEEPRAIYKWQKGESLPTVDNLYALGSLFEVPMEQILVPVIQLHKNNEQQASTCCSVHFTEVFTWINNWERISRLFPDSENLRDILLRERPAKKNNHRRKNDFVSRLQRRYNEGIL